METILDIIVVSACVISIVTNFVFLFSIQDVKKSLKKIEKDFPEILNDLMEKSDDFDEKLVKIPAEIDRSLVALKEDLKAHLDRNVEMANLKAATSRANNWDSMREAFKGPTRIEVNERT